MSTRIFNLIIIVLLLYLSSCEKNDEKCIIPSAGDAYGYPIRPGTDEWVKLSTYEEMISVCQIPEKYFDLMTTNGLIETVLNYPLFSDLYFDSNVQGRFDSMVNYFNGLQELLKREDAATELWHRYKMMDPNCNNNNWPSISRPGKSTSFSFAFIEIIIGQYSILFQLDTTQMVELLKEVLVKYEGKKVNEYSIFSMKHTMLIAGRIMILCNYKPFIDEYTNNEGLSYLIDYIATDGTPVTLDIVFYHAKNFLNN